MQTPQSDKLIAVWSIGTRTIPQVWATNWPAALQTATAILILPQQQSSISKKKAAIEKDTYPKISYSVVVAPEIVGILRYPEAIEEILMMPALLRKTTPANAKNMMIPKAEVQTINPARHFNKYMKMKEMRTAPPRAHNNHCQFYIN